MDRIMKVLDEMAYLSIAGHVSISESGAMYAGEISFWASRVHAVLNGGSDG